MYIFLIAIFLVHLYLLISTQLFYQPEIYLFSWLVSQGLVPYRDFFDHHGFLLHYLLLPFTTMGILAGEKIFYVIVQSVNLFLYIYVLRNIKPKWLLFLGSALYVGLNFFVSENKLWFETVITTWLLLILVFLTKKASLLTDIIIGLCIAFASFLKPHAVVIMFPVLLYRWRPVILYTLISSWVGVVVYFLSVDGLTALYTNLFVYNRFLFWTYTRIIRTDIYLFYLFMLVMFIWSLIVLYQTQRFRRYLWLVLLTLTCSLFLVTDLGKWHMLPLVTVLSLLYLLSLQRAKGKIFWIGIVLITCTTIYLSRKTIQLHTLFRTYVQKEETLYADTIYEDLKNETIGHTNLYIFNGHAIEYIHYGVLPPTYYPLYFPGIEQFDPVYEDRLINDLKKNDVKYIVRIPDPIFPPLPHINTFIHKEFKLINARDEYVIFARSDIHN